MGTHAREICAVPEATGDLASGLDATGIMWPVVIGGMHAGRVSRVAAVLVENHDKTDRPVDGHDSTPGEGSGEDDASWSVIVASADDYGQLLFWRPNWKKEPMAPPHWIRQHDDDNESSFSSPAIRHRVMGTSQRRRSLSSGIR
eukprot:scaffold556_cov221-Pinguiococcus_pyrenoidosus.AAC.3